MSEHKRCWQEIINKGLVPAIGKFTSYNVVSQKQGLKLSLARIFSVHSCQYLVPCFLTFLEHYSGFLQFLLTIEILALIIF